jgi:hypothetical protein
MSLYTSEIWLLAIGAVGLAYFFGLHIGHGLACTRIAALAEREKILIAEAVAIVRTQKDKQ